MRNCEVCNSELEISGECNPCAVYGNQSLETCYDPEQYADIKAYWEDVQRTHDNQLQHMWALGNPSDEDVAAHNRDLWADLM
jgi:hypothetical protein